MKISKVWLQRTAVFAAVLCMSILSAASQNQMTEEAIYIITDYRFKTRMGVLSVFAVPGPESEACCSIRWRDSLLRNMAGA